jgi:hypothetical protein
VVLLMAGLAVFQAASALQAATLTPDLAAQVALQPALAFTAGVLWALIFTLVVVNLLRRWRRGLLQAAWALLAFVIYSGARLILFARADYDRERLPFALLLLLLVSITPAVYLVRRHREDNHDSDT